MAKSPPAKRKSDGLVMRFTASSSKRSDRGRNISWSSSGPKFSDGRSSSCSSMATKEVGESEKHKLSAKDKKLGDPTSSTAWSRAERKKAKPTGNASVETSGGCLKRKKSIAVLEGSVASERKCGTKPMEGKHPQLRFCSGLSQGKRRREQCVDELSKTPEVQSDAVVKKRRTDFDTKYHSPHLEAGSKGKTIDGCKEGASVTPADTLPESSARSTACVYTKSKEKCASTAHNVDRNIIVTPEVHMVEGEERRKLLDAQKIRHLRLKPEISKLCEILQLCDAVKVMVQSLLKYVMINHQVNIEAATTLQAFQISLCWTVASFLKQKISHKKSLSLAKECLNFSCAREETDYFCAMLRCLKHTFLYHTEAESHTSGLKDHSPKASQSATSNLQKVGSKVEGVSVHLEDLAERDIDRGIKEIRKKFRKKMKKVIDKLEKEKSGVLKTYEVGKECLERQKETESAVSQSYFQEDMLARSDTLKMLEKEIEEHELHKVTCIENLEGLQRKAKNKLEVQESKWVNELRSWARSELLNRSTTNGPGRLPSCGEWTQNTDTMPISDVEVRLKVPETVSSTNCLEQPPSLNLSSALQNPHGDASRVLDEEAPLGFSSSHAGNKVEHETISLHQIHIGRVIMPDKGVESEVHEAVSSNDELANLVSVDPPSSEQQNLGKATEKEKSNLHVIESDTENGVCQKSGFNTSGNGNTNGENPLVPAGHPSTALVHGLSVTLDQADQGKGSLLATVPAMQSGDVQAHNMQDTSEPVEHSVATAPNNHSDHHVPYNEAAVQVQPVQSSITSGHNRLESTSAGGIGIQPSSEHHTFNQVAHAPVQIAENLPPLSDQPVDVSTCGSGLFFPETRATNVTYAFNDYPIHHPAPYGASVMSYPGHPDPLQSELEKLNRLKEQTHKSHEDTKQRLQSDCDKEIKEAVAEIHRKYEIRFQETDTEFHLKEKELDAMHNKVLMNHVLAWSFSKYMDSIRGSSALGVQQDGSFFVQQLNQQSIRQNAQRHTPVASSSLASPPAPSLQMSLAPLPNLQATSLAPPTSSHSTVPSLPNLQATSLAPPTSSHSPVPSMQTISLSTAVLPRIPARPPQISPFSPGNPQVGGELRAPAPHLQAYRPSASVPNWLSYNSSPTTFPSLHIPRNLGPAQQYAPFSRARSESREAVPSLTTASEPNSQSYSNSPATLPSLHIPRHPAPTQDYFPFSRARSESTAVPALRCNASALELVLNSGSGTNPPGSFPSRLNFGLNLDQSHLSGPAVPVGPCVSPVHSGSTGVVCLSDDD